MQIIEADERIRSDLNTYYIEHGYHSDWSDIERAFEDGVPTASSEKPSGSSEDGERVGGDL